MKMKKILAIVLSAMLLLGLLGGLMTTQAEEEAVWRQWVGDNALAQLYSDGTLTITGSGALWDCPAFGAATGDVDRTPALDQDGLPYGLVGENGSIRVTRRGPVFTLNSMKGIEGVDNGLPAVTSVEIGEGITYIGGGQLASVNDLVTSVTIPKSVTELHENAFYNNLPAEYHNTEGYSAVVKGYAGSAMEAYAKEHNITFVAIEEPAEQPTEPVAEEPEQPSEPESPTQEEPADPSVPETPAEEQPTQPAIPETPAEESASLTQDLFIGTAGVEVTALQQQLTALGYYDGIIDGDFGAYTEAAVIAFQKANGLYADGYAGPLTREKLANDPVAASAASASGQPEEPATPFQEPTTLAGDLYIGVNGAEVTALQQQLTALGYYDGINDGDFGAYTEAAVIAFQKANGLYADGYVGPLTREKLAANPVAANAAPAQESPVQPEVPAQGGDLSIGSVGDDVYVLQQQLAALGYPVGAVDGDFGSMTDAAVKAFQADNGLYVDGVVGSVTKAALGL